MTKPSTLDLLKEQCNRYTNGFCHTRRCLMRGGYSDDPAVDHEATCEYHEAVLAIEERDRLREAVEYAHSEGFEWPSDPMPLPSPSADGAQANSAERVNPNPHDVSEPVTYFSIDNSIEADGKHVSDRIATSVIKARVVPDPAVSVGEDVVEEVSFIIEKRLRAYGLYDDLNMAPAHMEDIARAILSSPRVTEWREKAAGAWKRAYQVAQGISAQHARAALVAERELSSLREQNERLRSALAVSTVLADDLLNVYVAEDMCNEVRVAEARERIASNGGTLAYIADVLESARAALSLQGGKTDEQD